MCQRMGFESSCNVSVSFVALASHRDPGVPCSICGDRPSGWLRVACVVLRMGYVPRFFLT